ncbi:hypothetical protein KIW84_072777 [Lathyrus oleraceus]|uniref:Uncharacterized protein n=1 Tax=Pisum sativum TaxID=3888 RepID=A0A9D4ZWG7_PEA|nr:hypothetical protein KIW84_072777 [Pisum sativum]
MADTKAENLANRLAEGHALPINGCAQSKSTFKEKGRKQLDVYDENEWSCTEDKKKYKELVEKDRVYKFLLGLNTKLYEVHGRILGTKSLQKIREAFLKIRREESKRKVMLEKSSATPSIEGSAMAARGDQCSFQKKTRPWCDTARNQVIPRTHAGSFMESHQS